MLGLAIDTSGPYLGLMLYNQSSCLQNIQHTQSRDHCASLIPQIQMLLEQQDKTLADIDQWSVVIGPGSFTGLRVGVMTVKTLAMTTDKPIVSVHNFDRLAQTLSDQDSDKATGLIWPAQKGHVYVCIQQGCQDQDLVKPCFLPWCEVPWTQADQWRYPDWMTLETEIPSTAHGVSFDVLTTQAWFASIQKSTDQHSANSLEPWYIQPSYAQKPAIR